MHETTDTTSSLEPVDACTAAPISGARSLYAFVLMTSIIAVLSVGCEESVDPFAGSEFPFTLWGFMNAGSDTQYVRVFPISDQLVPRAGRIDAEVYSTDLVTGERRQWSYEQVQFDSLIQGHVFWSPFRAVNEHRYRLEAVRSDGATSSATITVPSLVNFSVDVDTAASTVIPVRISGDVPNLVGVRVTYDAINVPPAKAWPEGTRVADPVQLPVSIGYDNVLRRDGNSWYTEIDLVRDHIAVEAFYEFNCLITEDRGSAPDIWLRGIEFSALAADSSWAPPGGVFDPNILSVPGTFSNVANGYGFFGAGMGIRYEWTPDVAVAVEAGYGFEPRCNFLFPLEVPECLNPPVPCVGEGVSDLWRIWLR